MLDVKNMFRKLASRVNFRTVEVTSPSFTITANSSKWQTVPAPTSGKPIAIIGVYIRGTGNTFMNIYCLQLLASGAAQIAIRSMWTNDATVEIVVRYLVVD